jgi:hypothetical protein
MGVDNGIGLQTHATWRERGESEKEIAERAASRPCYIGVRGTSQRCRMSAGHGGRPAAPPVIRWQSHPPQRNSKTAASQSRTSVLSPRNSAWMPLPQLARPLLTARVECILCSPHPLALSPSPLALLPRPLLSHAYPSGSPLLSGGVCK